MDHSVAPVLDALAAYHREGQFPFTPPGHKQGRGADPRVRAVLGDAVFAADVLAVAGLDDRRSTGGVLERAQQLMADAVGAEHTFFSTCGSSLSVKAAMLAVARPHEELLIGRDAHKSVIAGLILAGIRPVWVDPQWDAERHLAHPPSPQAFAARLEEHPDASGLLVTSPTPYGTCADLGGIVRVAHERGLPVVVDEAWGAHLPFHPGLPTWAMDAGADVCVTSVHKMGSGLEQGSVFHLQGDRITPETLAARADLLGTTSPSVLLYAGLDGWRRQMVEQGRELYDEALALADRTRVRIAGIDGLHVNGRDDFCGPGRAADMDTLQVFVEVTALGVSGYDAADWLRQHHRINLHVADHRRISAQLTHADDDTTAERLVHALCDLTAHTGDLRPAPEVALPSPAELRLDQAVSPRDAFFGHVEQVPCGEAAGRIAAEMLTPYPPGIPAALPGERLNPAVVDYLRSGVAAGMVVPDAADPSARTVRVLVEKHG
ncbi:aminotransferase class I/II-fold pyridoxal phosphate-dependent enzyme [Actinacidiphila bryophytorum]|uniref:Arginine decarboxylase n=1 Tax=Actinacidiphila bryophytorum TaxID=1436133 RepID=A0A9W4H2S0_9ACTN|nr:aminotransferase class I/II-fold pyridoxal phosphate-dependent enzyme [Actinacidiphila bryophytorum]MBM9436935.1 ornithine decarboxylase [Actinacidiphila bryophytorum]MBN6545129.1 ornithine decarboxylase [Actinacidiphila bryophytorum]CAG7645893.1 Arginine decarboxylase [Actinacidiphila bryophytorum]